jgi:hypothetical protein
MAQKTLEHPDKQVRLWCQDEARIGLKAITRRVWAMRGKRPIAHNWTRYEWSYVYCFICPCTGQSYFLILPSVNIALMTLAFEEFMRDINPKDDQVIVLMLDNAAWHSSKKVVVPKNLVLLPLPSYSPELSPAETIVPLVREVAANRVFADLDALEDVLSERCVFLMNNPDVVRGRAGFSWLVD